MALNILLTGASGILGSALLRQMLEYFPTCNITAVSRRPFESNGRVSWLQADLTDRESLAAILAWHVSRTDVVIHASADVRWHSTLKRAMAQNVTATENLLKVCEQFGRNAAHFVFVSTAFTEAPARKFLGDRPDQLRDTHFANNYEYTKFVAEQRVLSSTLRSTLIRPSLIAGSSEDGSISGYNGIYTLLVLLSRGLFPAIPCAENAVIDCVPVNLVAKSIIGAIESTCDASNPIHVTCGNKAVKLTKMFRIVLETLNSERHESGFAKIPMPTFLDVERYHRFHKSFILKYLGSEAKASTILMDAFLPYTSMTGTFPGSGILNLPEPEDYFSIISKYWADNNRNKSMAELYKW